MTPQLLHKWIVNWRNQIGLTSHVEFLKASGPKVISPLALPLRTVIPLVSFVFKMSQQLVDFPWFLVLLFEHSPFLFLQGPFSDLLLLLSHFPTLLLHFPSFLRIKPLMLHASTWFFWILHHRLCQHIKYLNISTNSQFPSFPFQSTVLACHPMEWLTPR